MNGALSDLVEMFLYAQNGQPYCQIYFKGRLEPYDTVRADFLLGDIIELCSYDASVIDNALNDSFGDIGNRIKINGKYYYLVAATIVSCYPTVIKERWTSDLSDNKTDGYADFKEVDIIRDTIGFVDKLSEKNISFTRSTMDMYGSTTQNYVLIYSVHSDYRKYVKRNINNSKIKISILDKDESLESILENGLSEYSLYVYDCDNLDEIMMALLHHMSLYEKKIKKCAVCNRVFMTMQRSDEKYCSRAYLNESCKMAGRKNVRRKRLRTDTITKKYNSICTNLSNRKFAKRIINNEQAQEKCWQDLERFKSEYREKKKSMKEGDLLEWMNLWLKHKEKKENSWLKG